MALRCSAALSSLVFFSVLLGVNFLTPAPFTSAIFSPLGFWWHWWRALDFHAKTEQGSFLFKTSPALGSCLQLSLTYSLTGTDRKGWLCHVQEKTSHGLLGDSGDAQTPRWPTGVAFLPKQRCTWDSYGEVWWQPPHHSFFLCLCLLKKPESLSYTVSLNPRQGLECTVIHQV